MKQVLKHKTAVSTNMLESLCSISNSTRIGFQPKTICPICDVHFNLSANYSSHFLMELYYCIRQTQKYPLFSTQQAQFKNAWEPENNESMTFQRYFDRNVCASSMMSFAFFYIIIICSHTWNWCSRIWGIFKEKISLFMISSDAPNIILCAKQLVFRIWIWV